MEMCICLSWQGASLVKVFIGGSCFPVSWHLCYVVMSGFYSLKFCIPHFWSDWRLFLTNHLVKGWTFFETLKWLKRHHVIPVWGWVHVPASHNQLSFLAALCQNMWQWWYARSSWAERGHSRLKLCLCSAGRCSHCLVALFCYAAVLECSLFPWGITGVKDRLYEWNLMV